MESADLYARAQLHLQQAMVQRLTNLLRLNKRLTNVVLRFNGIGGILFASNSVVIKSFNNVLVIAR